MKKIKVHLPILKSPKEIILTSLKEESNVDYCLLDTGSVLKLLPRFGSLSYRLDKGDINLAIPKKTIEQIIVHLVKSFSKRKKQQISTHNVEVGMRNFIKLLDDKRIKCPTQQKFRTNIRSNTKNSGKMKY